MSIRENYLTKKAGLLKTAIDNYHNTVRSQHDFVNALIISGANQDYKCADRDVADAAIQVTNEFNEHIDLPNMYFTGAMFTEEMKLQYVFEMYIDEHDGFMELLYVDGCMRAEMLINWGFKFEDVADSWLQHDLKMIGKKFNLPIEVAAQNQQELLEEEIKTHCNTVMQEIVKSAGSASNVVNQFVCIPDENGNYDDMLDLYFIREAIEEKLSTPKLRCEIGSLSLSAEGSLKYRLLVDVGDDEVVDRIGRAEVEGANGLVKIGWEYIDEQVVEE